MVISWKITWYSLSRRMQTFWDKLEPKYTRLMYTISKRITGDPHTCSIEDNYADLCVSALKAVNAYAKKTGKKPDDFIESKSFDQYIKTVLWNLKNSKGGAVTKKKKLYNKVYLSDLEESI